MKTASSSILAAAAVLLASLAHANPVAEAVPAPSVALSADTYEGCYSSAGALTYNNRYTYQTSGYCQGVCVNAANYAVMATTNSTDCYCGNTLPPKSDKVDDSNCNLHCAGYASEMCGSDDADYFSVYLTGVDNSVGTSDGDSSSSTSSTAAVTTTSHVATSTVSVKPSVVTVGGQTIIVTAAAQAASVSAAAAKSSGTNAAGIAAGVVVGVIAAAALAGGVFLWLRNKRRREVEEEYRRNAAVNNFVGQAPASSGGQSAMTDTRLDATAMAHNRLSTGSIADNQDYSRRILKVTNA